MGKAIGKVRIGISGWRYEPWRGVFYPPGLVQRDELAYASRSLPTVEINGTFYALQKPESFAEWHEDTPADFVFSVKAPKYITHVRRLKDIDGPLANFFASGLFELRGKLGPILWQFPPFMRFDAERFENFLQKLPRDTDAAQALARGHDDFLAGRASLRAHHAQPLRHAVEIRHESFVDEAFVDMLRRHGVALVVADTAGKWPYREDVCADFMYLRLHGDKELYASGYSDEALARWATRIEAWRAGGEPADAHRIAEAGPKKASRRDVYVYFDNDIKVKAPFDAMKLLDRLGLPHGTDDGRPLTIRGGGVADPDATPRPERRRSPFRPRRAPPPPEG